MTRATLPPYSPTSPVIEAGVGVLAACVCRRGESTQGLFHPVA